MDDRTLLEKAAKAAGIDLAILWPWNPLNDDGDEARLEAALGMHVHWWGNCVTVDSGIRGLDATEFFAEHGGDKQAARRLAGVRAAAALAEQRTGGRE